MADSIRKKMWEAMTDSPYVMVGLNDAHAHHIPMRAQLDPEAHGEFWFYTARDNRLAGGGPAMAQFVSKSHDLFACISGRLEEERDAAVIDRYWSNQVEAWYPGGRSDPNLLMLRFALDDAEIWTADATLVGKLKMMTGATVDPDEMGKHATAPLR